MQEFIRKKGVTECPSFGTPEFREMNIEREKVRAEEYSRKARGIANRRVAKLQKALRP